MKYEHIVVLSIRVECQERPMTVLELEKWILEHFEGCDYGEVSVLRDQLQ